MSVGFSRDRWYNYIADRSHPPVASAVVEIPEYDPDHVYAWKPANNYKGWKLLDRGEAGVDNAEVIQSALDVKGLVYLSDGEYVLNDTIFVRENTKFVASKNAIIKPIAGFDKYNLVLLKSYTIAEGLKVDGDKANNSTTRGITVGTNEHDVLIKDCRIENTPREAVYLSDSNYNIIMQNNFVYNCEAGLCLVGYGNNVSWIGNVIKDSGNIADAIAGYNYQNYNLVVVDNQIYNAPNHHGIHLGGSHITIADNVIDGAGMMGILLYSSNDPTKYADYVTITGNVVRNITARGIELRGCRYFTVTGNVVDNVHDYGIIARWTDTGGVSSYYGAIVGNTVRNVTVGSLGHGNGIAITNDSEYIYVIGNVIDTVDEYGILADVAGKLNAIVGNVIQNAASGAIYRVAETIVAHNVGYDELTIPLNVPSSPKAGDMYFDPSTGTLYVYDGSAPKVIYWEAQAAQTEV